MEAGLIDNISDLQRSVEAQHGGTATLAQSVPIKETHAGAVVWEGIVHVFDLKDHPTASRAYAWSSPIEGSDKRRFFAVLHQGPVPRSSPATKPAIKSPADSVGDHGMGRVSTQPGSRPCGNAFHPQKLQRMGVFHVDVTV
jgi:hypothetical protein